MVTKVWIFLGTFHNNALQAVRKILYFLGRRSDLLLQMLQRYRYRRVSVKRYMPRHHLI